jgi:hypothetical protein
MALHFSDDYIWEGTTHTGVVKIDRSADDEKMVQQITTVVIMTTTHC